MQALAAKEELRGRGLAAEAMRTEAAGGSGRAGWDRLQDGD